MIDRPYKIAYSDMCSPKTIPFTVQEQNENDFVATCWQITSRPLLLTVQMCVGVRYSFKECLIFVILSFIPTKTHTHPYTI